MLPGGGRSRGLHGGSVVLLVGGWWPTFGRAMG